MDAIRLSDIRWRYINLRTRMDRRIQAEKACKQHGISAKRFQAIAFRDWDWAARGEVFERYSTPGKVGCALSHLSLLKDATKRTGILGVLEDDVLFCDDFSERMQMIEDLFHDDWDIFFLNATFHLKPTWHKNTLGKDYEMTDTRHIARVYGLWCTQSYLVNCKRAGFVLDTVMKNLSQSDAIDHAFILSQPSLRCFCFVPGITAQTDGWSDITNSHTSYAGFFPHGPHVFCKHLDEFDYDLFLSMAACEYSPNATD